MEHPLVPPFSREERGIGSCLAAIEYGKERREGRGEGGAECG